MYLYIYLQKDDHFECGYNGHIQKRLCALDHVNGSGEASGIPLLSWGVNNYAYLLDTY